MKKTLMLFAAALVLQACDSDLAFVPPDPNTFVVQAFLFTGEPVMGVTVTGVLPIDADSTEVPDLISDALITIIRDGIRYDLIPTDGEPGTYHYPDIDLPVEVGDEFGMEVRWGNVLAMAETVVPSPPIGLALSAENLGFSEEASAAYAKWAELKLSHGSDSSE